MIIILHVRVENRKAQQTINHLREINKIDIHYKIKHDTSYVFIPVTEKLDEFDIVDIEPLEKVELEPKHVSFSYDIVGNIAIIKGKSYEEAKNLSKYLIERKNIKTVYIDNGISGEFRTRQLKLLNGNGDTSTLYHENGINLIVDVSKAYFSPRLSTERLRISNEIRINEKILDMFCGIGPFSILMAKKVECEITAIDKNEMAIELFKKNIELNKLKGSIHLFCGDSKELIKNMGKFDRIIMNLPHSAYDYILPAINAVNPGGIINYYEICNVDQLEARMEAFRDLGLEIVYKRIVHGFSKYENMYSIEMKKI